MNHVPNFPRVTRSGARHGTILSISSNANLKSARPRYVVDHTRGTHTHTHTRGDGRLGVWGADSSVESCHRWVALAVHVAAKLCAGKPAVALARLGSAGRCARPAAAAAAQSRAAQTPAPGKLRRPSQNAGPSSLGARRESTGRCGRPLCRAGLARGSDRLLAHGNVPPPPLS